MLTCYASNRCARREGRLHNAVLLLYRTMDALRRNGLAITFDDFAHSVIVGQNHTSGKTVVR